MLKNLVSDQPSCVSKEVMYAGNHSWLLSKQWMGLLVHWNWMIVWDMEVLIMLDLQFTLTEEKKSSANCLILLL